MTQIASIDMFFLGFMAAVAIKQASISHITMALRALAAGILPTLILALAS